MHRLGVDAVRIQHDGDRVAVERPLREDVYLLESIRAHGVSIAPS